MSRQHIPHLVAVALALLGWELLAWALASPVLPGPRLVGAALLDGFRGGGLATDIGASLSRVLVGFGLAAVLGLGLGAAVAMGGRVAAPVGTVLELLRPVPPIAWVPLAILWFGLGDPSAWFICFVGAFFPIFIQVHWALGHCPPPLLELARSMGLGPMGTLRAVRLPAAAPGIASGLRTGLGLAWTSVIAAELVGAQSGLGYRIQMHRLVLETEAVVAGMVCIGLLGFGMDAVVGHLQRRWIHWGPT